MISFTAKRLSLPLPENKTGGWAPYPLFQGSTPSLAFMGCHVSVLSSGRCPHPPHSHIEEELLIVLEGEAVVEIAASPEDRSPRLEDLAVGQFSYYPAWQHHTIRNRSTRPVIYLMFKWSGNTSNVTGVMPAGIFDYRGQLAADEVRAFAPRNVLNHGTNWLKRLHCHVTKLRPGAGYVPHIDRYDVAIVMLAGMVETNGHVLAPCDIVFYGAGALHGMRNVSSETAKYLVFEFERP